ncbi:hypothetical protein PUN28_011354 [Cardiocondyla obscurior]|uniref:Uncharacterized protein n=1 Tax=Cardiocondyla obscurior TaxID=286306 RepID=A0AAW2FFY4_9HYME
MWILCTLIGLFQLITLLMLSGVLFSVAAISRLMEIMIILLYPTAVFLLRQASNLIIILTILTVKMTSSTFHKLCTLVKYDLVTTQQDSSPITVQLDMQIPFIPYKNSILEEIPQDILLLKDQVCTALLEDKGIIEPTQNEQQDNSSIGESTT